MIAKQHNAYVRALLETMYFLKYQNDVPRFKPDADDATENQFIEEDLIEDDATVLRIFNAVLAHKDWKLGLLLGFNFP